MRGHVSEDERNVLKADAPFMPVFIPLSPCWVTGLSVTLIGADRTPAVGMEAPPLTPVPGATCVED